MKMLKETLREDEARLVEALRLETAGGRTPFKDELSLMQAQKQELEVATGQPALLAAHYHRSMGG